METWPHQTSAPLIQAYGFGFEALALALYLSEPAAILVFLWLVYGDRYGAEGSQSVSA